MRRSDRQTDATTGLAEFVVLMAMMTALAAMSIDMLLPALPVIGAALGVTRANDNQLIISLLFLGFAFGQVFYGPLSDSTGRKPGVYVGLGLFIAGSLLALVADRFSTLLIGRFLQGAGAAGPRTITMALVRDRFEGRSMARVMSLITTVFILVPVVAPAFGQAVLSVSGWRTIFGVYLTTALIACAWFALRQEETLPPDRRLPFTAGRMAGAVADVLGNRPAVGYTIAAGTVFGPFLGYLNSAQQILQEQYGLGTRFPAYFATLAIALGAASFANARLVMRYGMRHLSVWALRAVCGVSIVFLGVAYAGSGHPPLPALMAYLIVSFFCIGLLFGNLNAMAMQPLGRAAGTGAAVVGALSTFISLGLGALIGQSYNGTVLPLIGGFAVLSVLAMLAMRWAEAGRALATEDVGR